MQYTLYVCLATENCKKNTKPPYFRGVRSFKVIDVAIIKRLLSLVLVIISNISASICKRFHATQANSGK